MAPPSKFRGRSRGGGGRSSTSGPRGRGTGRSTGRGGINNPHGAQQSDDGLDGLNMNDPQFLAELGRIMGVNLSQQPQTEAAQAVVPPIDAWAATSSNPEDATIRSGPQPKRSRNESATSEQVRAQMAAYDSKHHKSVITVVDKPLPDPLVLDAKNPRLRDYPANHLQDCIVIVDDQVAKARGSLLRANRVSPAIAQLLPRVSWRAFINFGRLAHPQFELVVQIPGIDGRGIADNAVYVKWQPGVKVSSNPQQWQIKSMESRKLTTTEVDKIMADNTCFPDLTLHEGPAKMDVDRAEETELADIRAAYITTEIQTTTVDADTQSASAEPHAEAVTDMDTTLQRQVKLARSVKQMTE